MQETEKKSTKPRECNKKIEKKIDWINNKGIFKTLGTLLSDTKMNLKQLVMAIKVLVDEIIEDLHLEVSTLV